MILEYLTIRVVRLTNTNEYDGQGEMTDGDKPPLSSIDIIDDTILDKYRREQIIKMKTTTTKPLVNEDLKCSELRFHTFLKHHLMIMQHFFIMIQNKSFFYFECVMKED